MPTFKDILFPNCVLVRSLTFSPFVRLAPRVSPVIIIGVPFTSYFVFLQFLSPIQTAVCHLPSVVICFRLSGQQEELDQGILCLREETPLLFAGAGLNADRSYQTYWDLTLAFSIFQMSSGNQGPRRC